MRDRTIRCPYCGTVQQVPGAAGASLVASSPPRPRGPALEVEPVPERIVIESDDLDDIDLPPRPAAREPTAMLNPHHRARVHQAWQRREKLNSTDDAVGQTCPYCITKLAPDVEAVICPACGTPHHAECWVENEGCCLYGCSLAPFRTSIVQPPGGPVPAMPPTCRGCGVTVRPDDIYCTSCGRPVSSPSGGRAASTRALRPQMSRMSREAVLFGLLSLVCGPLFLLFSPLAVYYGLRALRNLRGEPQQSGQSAATAGIVLGILSAVLWLIVALAWLPHIMR